jgi:murein DD-endopeptidase MepM/ murein hydrolase activator NlpD
VRRAKLLATLLLPLAALSAASFLHLSPLLPPLRLQPAPQFNAAQVRPPGLELAADETIPFERTLGRGESLASLLAELGLDPKDRYQVSLALADHVELRRLRPGLRVAALLGTSPRPAALRLEVPGKGRLRLAVARDGWQAQWQAAVESMALQRVQVVIHSNVAEALEVAGAPLEVAYRAADVLRWDVDFTRDLREGDRLQVLYEQLLIDGVPTGVGDVLAVALENRGQLVEAYRYGDGGYYDADGIPLRKMFLRSPIAFSTRITSGFSLHRFHPILKEFRPHWGIDIGAPTGTPVHVTADGVVLAVGWDGGGGRTVKVRHPSGFITCYLHLSSFAKGLTRGDRVRQGEVVGFVGQSGLATAPHLDYRVQQLGRWVDPLSLKSVPAAPLSRREMATFVGWREELRLALRSGVMPSTTAGEWQLAGAPERVETPAAIGGR